MFRLFVTDIELDSKKMARLFIVSIVLCILTCITALGIGGFSYYRYEKSIEINITLEKGLTRALDERAQLMRDKEELQLKIDKLDSDKIELKKEISKLDSDKSKIQKERDELNKKIKTIESSKKEVTKPTTNKTTVKKEKPKTVSNLTPIKHHYNIERFKYAYDLDITKKHDQYMRYSMDKSHVEEALKVLKNNNIKFDPHVLFAIYAFESKFNHNLRTGSGSGYGQLIYTTGKWRYETVLKKGTYKRDMALDPIINIQITADYFADIVRERKGDLYESLRRYNGNAIGDLYMRKISQTLVKYTGKDLEYYNLQSKKLYK